MADTEDWIDIGSADELSQAPLQQVSAEQPRASRCRSRTASSASSSNACNHVGGPLGEGRLDGDYVTCPWHDWKFHRCTGKGEPGFEEDAVPAYPVKVEGGRVLVDLARRRRKRTAQAASAASAGAQDRARSPARCGSPASRPPRWTRPIRASPAPTICSTTRSKPRPTHGAETQADPAQRAEIPRLRGLLLEGRARLHLAVLDHADGRRATRWTASMRRWCTGPTPSSSPRRSAGARPPRSISRWPSGSTACRTPSRSATRC